MTNPLTKNEMFASPESAEQLQKYLMQFSGQERVIAMTAAAMAWNLAADLVNKELS